MAEPAAGTSPLGSTSIVQDPAPRVPSPVSSDRRTSISSGTPLPKNDVPGWPSAVPEQEQEQREQGQVQGPSPPTVNGVALATAAAAVAAAATASQSRAASPTPGPDTPQSHAHPSTPNPHAVSVTAVNGQVAPPPPTSAPGTGTSSTVSSASNPATGIAGARSKEQFLRWRDPMTVKYDSGSGHAQPGKLQPSNPSPQLKQEHAQPQTQAVQQPGQQPGQQSQPQPQQFSTPPSRQLQSQPLPQPQLPVLQTQAQHQQNLQPSHSQHAQQQLHQQPQYIQVSHQQAHHSHPQSYPQPHVHPQLNHSQPLHPPPPPPQAAATALPPLHHQHPHPSHLPIHCPPSGRPLATQTRSKPVIMDPPRKASPQIKGFPSPGPGADHPRRNPKFVDDCTRMTYAVQQSLPEAVRRTVRDHWEKCLLGSEFHQAFILNASIHHAGPSITRRAVQDFGEKMIQESKAELIGHFKTEDLDQIAHLIIEKASDSFLDKCLAKRLQTIEAKPLINALAKAERLGYEPGDIVEGDQHEHVIPQEAFPGAAAAAAAASASGANGVAPSRPVSHPPQPQPQQYPPHQQLQCLRCFRTFTQPPAYEHHTAFSVCTQIPPTNKGFEHSCPYCGQGFTRLDELQTHLENRVCLTPNKASRGPGRPARSAPPTQPNPVSILPSVNQTPGLNGYNFSYDPAQATPTHRSKPPRSSVGTPNSVASPNPSDPYAHLTPEKLEAMNQELQNAEVTYAPRFAEAEAIADENERRARIEGLRNSFGTKQSMIRKKYGVRLRERRTKAEIAAERERLGLKKAEREKAKAIIAKQQLAAAANASSQLPPAAGSTGWTAANTTQAAQGIWDDHDAKRRRLDGTGGYQANSNSLGDDTPTPKILSVSQLGAGLSGTPATAELQDPTRPPQPAQQASKQRQQAAPETVTLDSESPSPNSGENPAERAVSISDDASRRASLQQSTTVSPRPAETTQPGADVMDVDSDSSDDDEDIPSTLPAHVRSTLGQQTYGLHA